MIPKVPRKQKNTNNTIGTIDVRDCHATDTQMMYVYPERKPSYAEQTQKNTISQSILKLEDANKVDQRARGARRLSEILAMLAHIWKC